MRDIWIFPDTESLQDHAADAIASYLAKSLQQNSTTSLVLAGGSTPAGVYARLTRKTIDWHRLHIFWGDERAVPPDHEQSNYGMAKRHLLDHVNVPPDQVHRMPVDDDDLEQAARSYEKTLRQVLGTSASLDLVLLGLGGDAHTASLFPDHAALREDKRWVVATPAPAIAPRLTLTFPALNKARCVWFLVQGESKAEALRRVWQAEGSIQQSPARGVSPGSGQVGWFVDAAAAGLTA